MKLLVNIYRGLPIIAVNCNLLTELEAKVEGSVRSWIGAGIRREYSGRRVDLSKIKFPVMAGVVTLEGELSFVG